MRFLCCVLALALAAGAGASGCSGSELDAATSSGGHKPFVDGATIAFDQDATLALPLGASETLHVTTSPPGRYLVRFALIGASLDGSLESGEVECDDAGRAEVVLHAPAKSTAFSVRASILDEAGEPGASAEIGVAVSDEGFGTLRVIPLYKGSRPVHGWTASVVAGAKCEDISEWLPGEPPGALVATALGKEGIPLLENAPVGPTLAVAIRAGHFAWGCATTNKLAPDATLDVKVTVLDKAVDLAQKSLDLALLYTPPEEDYALLLADMAATLGYAFVPVGVSGGELLLDGMEALVPAGQLAAFQQARVEKKWDLLAEDHLAALGVDVRDQIGLWATAGLVLGDTRIDATLTAGTQPMHASLTVTSFGGVDAATAGIVAAPEFTWGADSTDTVSLGGVVLWQPTRFAGAAALLGAQADVPSAATVPAALAELSDCTGLAEAMGTFGVCDTACIDALCRVSLGVRWEAALGASLATGALGQVTINASGKATVDDAAEPTDIEGHWLGVIKTSGATVSVTGDLTTGPLANPPTP